MKNRKPVIADIARRANVSTATVSRALNNSPLVSPELHERVHGAARELDYRMHSGARNLRRQRTEIVALVIRSSWWHVSNPVVSEFTSEISDALKERGYDLLITSRDPSREHWIDRLVRSRRVDGLIILNRRQIDPDLDLLAATGIPFVVHGAPVRRQGFHSAGFDNFAGGYLAGQHLVELGHRRVAAITGPLDHLGAFERLEGLRRALGEAGLHLPLASTIQADYQFDSARTAMMELLDQLSNHTAVAVFNDLMAIAALDVVKMRGLSVPDDLSMVSFDDIPLAAYISPPLTTIHFDFKRLGRILAINLLRLIDGIDVEDETLAPTLVVRRSTAPPRGESREHE